MKNNLTIIDAASFQQTECIVSFAQSLISAGFPSSAENFVEHAIDLNDVLIHNKSATFFIRVLGDSMIDAGIRSHDILIVDRSLTPAHNKIAVVRVNDEFTVKRIMFINNSLWLMPANDAYPPLQVTAEIDFEIWGIVTFVIHKPT